jgi:hypothetical protein
MALSLFFLVKNWAFTLLSGWMIGLLSSTKSDDRSPQVPAKGFFHMAFAILTRPPDGQIFPEAGPTIKPPGNAVLGPAYNNKFKHFGPVFRLGEPLENPLAGTCRLCQI